MPKIGFKNSNETKSKPSLPGQAKAKSNSEKFPPAPDGSNFNAVLTGLEYREVDPEKEYWKKHKDEIKFKFTVDDPDSDFNKRNFWAQVPFYWSNSQGCRLRIWIQELLGIDEFPEDFEFDTEELDSYVDAKLEARIRVKQFDTKKGPRNEVEDVMRTLNTGYEDADEIF